MTGLLAPSRTAGSAASGGQRPVVLGAALAGAAAAGAVLVGCMALALAAWFAADQGSHGTTRDALRIGSDAWLLAHGSRLDLGFGTVTVIPLGLTLLCGHVCFRMGRLAGQTSYAEDSRALAIASGVLGVVYGLVALVVALLASTSGAEPHLGLAFGGGLTVAILGGGPGLAVGSGRLPGLVRLLPEPGRAVAYAATLAALGVMAAGGVLVAAALLLDLGSAANVLARLDAGSAGGAFLTLLVAGFAPNAALFASSYLVGPGFAVGAGTTVSASGVSLGAVPAFPLLAALPAEGEAPRWALLLLLVPVAVAFLAGRSAVRAFPCSRYDVAALRGLLGGLVGGLLLGVAMGLCGGAVGPGRMAQVGPAFLEPTLLAMLGLGIGSALGALFGHWRRRPAPDGTEPTVDLSAEEPTVRLTGAALFRR